VDAAVRAARAAFDDGRWGRMTGVERGRLLRRLADVIAEHAEEIAVVEATDNGKLIWEMRGPMLGLADYYQFFAGAAGKIGGETIPSDKPNSFTYTLREPVGRRDSVAIAPSEFWSASKIVGTNSPWSAATAISDVDPRIQLEATAAPGAVGKRMLLEGERTRLDDQVVHRRRSGSRVLYLGPGLAAAR
jgi:hypothetical protein